MTRLGRIGCGAICVLVLLFCGANSAGAWGALAIGKTYEDTQTATSAVVGKATEEEARQAALESCRTAKNKSDAARSACAVVKTFQNQCFAFAGPRWAVAVNEQAAQALAAAYCYGSSCAVNSGCDVTAK